VSAALRPVRAAGFTLLPVILAMSLIAAIAFLLNRDNGVNARMIANRSDLDRARYAAEAGLQAVNFVIQGMGCTGTNYPTSSPVTNFFGATYSAYASRASLTSSNAPITLYSTGSYNGTSVTLTRNTVYVYQSSRTTTVVRPGQSGQPAGYDTYLDSGSPDRNFGGDSILKVSSSIYQSLLKFDLSAFPIGSRAIPWYDGTTLQPGAKLSLYQTDNGPATSARVNAQLITHNWVAGTGSGGTNPDGATWFTYDVNATLVWPSPRYAPVPVASTPYINARNVWVDWDLTNAAAAWMSGVYPPNGIWLVASDATVGNTAWVSSNNTGAMDTSGKRAQPKLTLTTLLPCGTTAPPSASDTAPASAPTTVTLAAVADTYITADTSGTPPYYVRNYGIDTNMYVGNVGSSPNIEQRLLLKFDLSGIPTGSIITSATLRLYVNQITGYSSSTTKTLDAYALTEWWAEGTSQSSGSICGATWISRDCQTGYMWSTWTGPGPTGGGGTYGSSLIATGCEESSGACPLPFGFGSGWVTWDLTALAQGWVDGVMVNNGLLVKSRYPGESSYSVKLVTDENNSAGGSHRPQLVVVYQ